MIARSSARTAALCLAIALAPACRGAVGRSERADDHAVAAALPPVTDECRADMPLPVRVVRLAQSELVAHLSQILGDDVVGGEGAPVFYLQGDHTQVAVERSINSIDFSSYRTATRALARRTVARLPADSPCRADGPAGTTACTHGPLKALITRLLRGQLDADEWSRLVRGHSELGRQFGGAQATEAVLAAALLSPHLLFRTESGGDVRHTGDVPMTEPEALQFASFAVLGRAPNAHEQATLLASAGTAPPFNDRLARTARSWTRTPAFIERMTDFVEDWLGVSHLKEKLINVDGKKDKSAVMLKEFRLFVQDNFLAADGNFARLFTRAESRYFPDLDDIYDGRFVPPDRNLWDERTRKGVLGLAGLLSAHAGPQASDPVQRGMLIRLRILCEQMPPPIPNASFTKVNVTDDMQTRERFSALASAPACRSCHLVINPPGYLFEGFDQFGRHRQTEKGRAVNASGGIPAFFGKDPYAGVGTDWSGITDLGDWLAEAPEARLCFARTFSNYVLSALVFSRTDNCALGRIAARFIKTGVVADLVEDLVRSDVFRHRARNKDDDTAGARIAEAAAPAPAAAATPAVRR